ncbi:ABC transporter ATP-binding protein [Thorsellia kenyensis]|uniref:ABC transporter ATP-binding protein n=1 Tax=Thorsellia kenyensis TaxID=1549888 RepID=A0ABV6CBE6_9GAMM
MTNTLIKITNVSKVYSQNKDLPFTALNNINLNISKGKFTVFAGKSGSGKSTLLHLIGAMDLPSKGQIVFEDYDITKKSDKELSFFRRNHIGFIFQSFNLLPILTASENVEYPLMLQGVSKKERKKRAKLALEEVQLDNKLNHYPRELSGGQMQRVAIARAIVHNPRLIIADEPTANLDSQTGIDIINLLQNMIKNHNIALVLASHDESIINQADESIFIKDGCVVSSHPH